MHGNGTAHLVGVIELLGDLFGTFEVDIEDGNMRTISGQPTRSRATNAACCSGHNSDFAG